MPFFYPIFHLSCFHSNQTYPKRHYLQHYCYHDVRRDTTMQIELKWCVYNFTPTTHHVDVVVKIVILVLLKNKENTKTTTIITTLICHNLSTWQVMGLQLYHPQLITWISCGKFMVKVVFLALLKK